MKNDWRTRTKCRTRHYLSILDPMLKRSESSISIEKLNEILTRSGFASIQQPERWTFPFEKLLSEKIFHSAVVKRSARQDWFGRVEQPGLWCGCLVTADGLNRKTEKGEQKMIFHLALMDSQINGFASVKEKRLKAWKWRYTEVSASAYFTWFYVSFEFSKICGKKRVFLTPFRLCFPWIAFSSCQQ